MLFLAFIIIKALFDFTVGLWVALLPVQAFNIIAVMLKKELPVPAVSKFYRFFYRLACFLLPDKPVRAVSR
jgi:hypothetical protein